MAVTPPTELVATLFQRVLGQTSLGVRPDRSAKIFIPKGKQV